MAKKIIVLLVLAALELFPAFGLAQTKIKTSGITDQAVTTAKIADNAVTTGKVALDTLTASDLAPDAVGSSEIAADAVGTDEIADGTVAVADLAATLDLSGKTVTLPASFVTGAMLSNGGWTYGAQTAMPAGASVDLITNIPAWATEVEIIISGVSHATASAYTSVQLGDAGGFETTTYVGYSSGLDGGAALTEATITAGLPLGSSSWSAADTFTGVYRLARWDTAEHLWMGSGAATASSSVQTVSSGSKTLSEALTSVRLVTSAGNWDAGEARVRYR